MKSRAPKHEQHSVTKEFLLFLSIPLGVIIILVAVLQGPSLFAKPKYDFIYALCPDYSCDGSYAVNAGGQLTFQQYNNDYSTEPTLYYYSESQHSSRQITATEGDGFNLDSSNVSPDGYTLWQNNGSANGFLFWGGNGDGNWYLKSGAKKKQLNISANYIYVDQVHFIGWVKK